MTAVLEAPVDLDFPLDSFKDAARHMRRPFTSHAVKFKVQATWPKDNPHSGLIVGYIDARLAVERLNLLVPHLWHDAYRPVANEMMWCDLTVDGITRSDVGEGKGKGLPSDALKRAAVKFGIGVSLYAIPKMTLNVESGGLKADRQGKLALTPTGETLLRGMYEHWLAEHGTKAFGEPLDHGDVSDAQGDAEAETPTTHEDPEPVPDPVSQALDGSYAPIIDPAHASDVMDAIVEKHMTTGDIKALFGSVGVTVDNRVLKSKEGLLDLTSRLTVTQADELADLLVEKTK